mgnify:CR=1 FL=1
MKKFLLSILVLLAAVSLYATDLNIYASGLKVHQTASGATIDYMLNAPATTLNVKIYTPGNDTPAKTIDLSGTADNLTKGAHAGVVIDFSDLANGVYTWAIEAGAAANEASGLSQVNNPNNDGAFQYYLPQDVVVDNSFESPYFGRVYVSESTVGQADGGSATTKAQTRGIYIYNSDLTFVNGQSTALIGYDGGLGGTTTAMNGFKRLAIDDNGYVYVASRDAATYGVYRMDPSDPSANFETILDASNAVDAIEIVDNVLFTLEGVGIGTGTYNQYNLSNTPASIISSANQSPILHFANANCSWRSDNRGGFWGSQYRSGLDSYPALIHINASGVKDYEISQDANTSLLVSGNASRRGVVAINPTGNLLAMSSDKRAVVFSIEYDAQTSVPTLTKLYETAQLGNNVDGVGFDVADNLYVLTASVERFFIYAAPKTAGTNSFTTPAPTSQGIALPYVEHLYEIGDNQGWETNNGVEMNKISPNVFEKEITFSNSTSYFTLSSAIGESWDVVNAARYGADNNNEPIANGDVKTLHLGWQNSFAIPAGKYRITADLNALTVTVKQLYDNLYKFDDVTGSWNLGDGTVVNSVAENVFEGEYLLPKEKQICFSTTNGESWALVNVGQLGIDSTTLRRPRGPRSTCAR